MKNKIISLLRAFMDHLCGKIHMQGNMSKKRTQVVGMYSAKDIANAFVSIFKNEEDGIANLKVQKLLYYAQGFSYQRFDRPLFPEEIEAWDKGPVVNSVYATYARYEDNPITECHCINLNADTERLILDIARDYGKYSPSDLATMTHSKGTPWEQFRTLGENHTVIPKEAIRKYFIEVAAKLPELDWQNAYINTLPKANAKNGEYDFSIAYDSEADVWFGSNDDTGLVLEASSRNELIHRLKEALPEMVALNSLPNIRNITFHTKEL